MLQQAQPVELKDFFAAAEAREDRWQQLNSLAQSWRRAALALGRGVIEVHLSILEGAQDRYDTPFSAISKALKLRSHWE
jgi:hypothetical protein